MTRKVGCLEIAETKIKALARKVNAVVTIGCGINDFGEEQTKINLAVSVDEKGVLGVYGKEKPLWITGMKLYFKIDSIYSRMKLIR